MSVIYSKDKRSTYNRCSGKYKTPSAFEHIEGKNETGSPTIVNFCFAILLHL